MAKMEFINGEKVLVDRKPKNHPRKKLQTLGDHVLEHFHIKDNVEEYKNKLQKPISKEWRADIIRNIINSITDFNIESVTYNNTEYTFSIQFIKNKDSELFSDLLLKNIFKFTNEYLINKELNPKDYSRSFVIFTDISEYNLIIKL